MHVNVREDNLCLPRRLQRVPAAAVRLRLDLMVRVVWILLLVLAVVVRYGEQLVAQASAALIRRAGRRRTGPRAL